MARTKMVARRSYRPTRCRLLVVSLLPRNPTAVEETTAAGVRTRARSRRITAASAALPEEILVWEIFVRLPAKDILRCSAVCRSWRSLTSAPDFLLAHHRRQPSLPLLMFYCTDSAVDGGLSIVKHGRPVLRFDDYDNSMLLASCDGLLLLSLSNGRFCICNPTTRRSALLPGLTAAGDISIAALYLHHPSGKYRVLYWSTSLRWAGESRRGALNFLHISQVSRKLCCPRTGMDILLVVWRHPSFSATVFTGTLAAATRAYSFSTPWLNPLGSCVARLLLQNYALSLCDMEGSLGYSCNDDGGRTVVIWVLQDHKSEVWSFKYRVELPVESVSYLESDTQHLVLSHKGDLLVYRPYKGYMFHCDSTGKLLEEIRCDSLGFSIIGHRFKESLVKHDISLRRGYARIFQKV